MTDDEVTPDNGDAQGDGFGIGGHGAECPLSGNLENICSIRVIPVLTQAV